MLMGLGGEVWGERATGKKKRVQYTHIKMASNSQGRVPGNNRGFHTQLDEGPVAL